jgi:hypothetical protein
MDRLLAKILSDFHIRELFTKLVSGDNQQTIHNNVMDKLKTKKRFA